MGVLCSRDPTSPRMSPRQLEELQLKSNFSVDVLLKLQQTFLEDYPLGYLTLDEFEESIRAEGSSDSEVARVRVAKRIFRTFNTSKDGKMTFEQFALALDLLQNGTAVQKLETAFSLFDLDRKGKVTLQNILDLHTCHGAEARGQPIVSEDVLAQRLRTLDLDRDGVLSRGDFLMSKGDPQVIESLCKIQAVDAAVCSDQEAGGAIGSGSTGTVSCRTLNSPFLHTP